jgi:hypothetical protein
MLHLLHLLLYGTLLRVTMLRPLRVLLILLLLWQWMLLRLLLLDWWKQLLLEGGADRVG